MFLIVAFVAILAIVPRLFAPVNLGLSKTKFSIVADSIVSNKGFVKLYILCPFPFKVPIKEVEISALLFFVIIEAS